MTSSTVSSESVARQERGDPYGMDHHPATVSSERVERQERRETRTLLKHQKSCQMNQPKPQNQIKMKTPIKNGDTCAIPKCGNGCKNFRENLVDDRVPELTDSHASSSHEPSLEPTLAGCVDLGKHSVYTHFPKDRNCEIWQRTQITRAPCRRRIDRVVLRAENFCHLFTADHTVPGEGCAS